MQDIIKAKYKDKIKAKLDFLYSESQAQQAFDDIINLVENYLQQETNTSYLDKSNLQHKLPLDATDIFLITYGDSIKSKDESPLATLKNFLNTYLCNIISYVHILPFYPYSSDDGFAIIDYFQVNKELGDWQDISLLTQNFKLMFDVVINHISAQSKWVQGFLRDEAEFSDYFIAAENVPELAKVTRPRVTPLLSEFASKDGKKLLWTTFSADQVDLNYKNAKLLVKIIELLLFYVHKGASAIRLDAIGYLWKEIGTKCIHLPQTHAIIQLFRLILDCMAPQVLIITETNVPHRDNISYFGDGYNEAQLVYQFPLPPLVFNALLSGNAEHLLTWAENLFPPSNQATFFNFLASHDGIGIMPVTGILATKEIDLMIAQVCQNGGKVSYKTNPDGSSTPYELNINYYDALYSSVDNIEVNVARFIVAHAVLLALQGVPAFYIHSLLGSRNDLAAVARTGQNRTINREKLNQTILIRELQDKNNLRNRIFANLCRLIKIRRQEKSFHPNAKQIILSQNKHVFAVARTALDNSECIVALHNMSRFKQQFVVDMRALNGEFKISGFDLVTQTKFTFTAQELKLKLDSYQAIWLKCKK